jgi:hypothetical protein
MCRKFLAEIELPKEDCSDKENLATLACDLIENDEPRETYDIVDSRPPATVLEPDMENELDSRAADLIDIEDPRCKELKIEQRPVNLPLARTLNVDPKLTQATTLHFNTLPKAAAPAVENEDPNRRKFLKLIDDPKVNASKLEHLLPHRTPPLTDKEEPRVHRPRIEETLPA